MKKNRNTFFTESQMTANMGPNMGMPNYQPSMQPNMWPGMQSQMMSTPLPDSNNELEARLTRIERQLHRLEARINKLEGGTQFAIDSEEYNSSMYMI